MKHIWKYFDLHKKKIKTKSWQKAECPLEQYHSLFDKRKGNFLIGSLSNGRLI